MVAPTSTASAGDRTTAKGGTAASASTSSGSSSINWKNPSASHMEKYHLVPLPDKFVPTREETLLLEMYETVRQCEKEASRIKEQAAKDKLAAADAKYKQQQQEQKEAEDNETNIDSNMEKKKKKKKRRKTKKHRDPSSTAVADVPSDDDYGDGDMEGDEDDIESDSDGYDDEGGEESLSERREARLAEMREEVEQSKLSAAEKAAAEEEALRAKLLETKEEVDFTGPALKRKRMDDAALGDTKSSSLIANIGAAETPPHEFSKNLGLKSWEGKVIYPGENDEKGARWEPPEGVNGPIEGSLILELADFDPAQANKGKGNNTIAIKFMAPSDSKRFSINITHPDHDDFLSVMFHFNPRQHERGGQVVVNDKQEGIWGQGINLPLSQVPLIFGQTSVTLVIQINGDGFDVYLDGQHCCRLEHRTPLPPKNGPLILQFPSTDDYGSPESWSVYKVWWGHKNSMAGDLSDVKGVNAFSGIHPKKLFISGLPRISTQAEVDLRRAELERAFRKYGGDQGVIATVPTNTTFAFVEVETERSADAALTEMQDLYRMNRARRSRYEALQEERAAKEAAANKGDEGGKKDNSEWD